MAMSIALSSISDSFATPHQLQEDGDEGLLLLPEVADKTAIFGRSKEISTLSKTFQKLRRTKKSQTVIVHGKSGSGKTVLVDTLLGPVFDANAYFVSGKFFQNEALQEPFSAIMAAFSDLCDLVVQSDGFDDAKQQEIAKALKTHSHLLVKAISNYTSLTGVIVDHTELEQGGSSVVSFEIACKAFLHTLASADHPIVIFLDDIQWADGGSVALIEMLLQDTKLTNVMIILAYRDEESKLAENLIESAPNPIDIQLSNLDAHAVLDMVTFMMGTSSTTELQLLSDLIVTRTSGNPFYIALFLETIEHEGLLNYEEGTNVWHFDVDEIRQAVMVSDAIADLLTRKINRLSDEIKETLKVASVLGYRFEESVLISVMCIASERTHLGGTIEGSAMLVSSTCASMVRESLSEAAKGGFIETTSNGYQFTHDKLQFAFRDLTSYMEEKDLNHLIGEVFLSRRAEERSNIYKAAVHLNAVPAPMNHEDRARLARINLDAAKYCAEISAFDRASTALNHGLRCLNEEEQGSQQYLPLTLELMEALGRNNFIIGNLDDCKAVAKEAFRHSMTTEMKVKFHFIDIDARMTANEVEGSITASRDALATLGIKMPHKVTIRHVAAKLLKVKWMLKNKTNDCILSLPLTTTPLIPQSVKLLVNICSHYFIKDKHEIAIWCALVAVKLTLKEGLSLFSPGAFTFYGIAESVIGNQARGYQLGELALAMLDRMESREADCATIGCAMGLLTYRKKPLTELVEPLNEAAISGFKYGDIGYAAHCVIQCFTIGVHLSTNLVILEEFMRDSYMTISELGQNEVLPWLQPQMQYVQNMQMDVISSWNHISRLSGEVMEEESFLDSVKERHEELLAVTVYLVKARIAGDFGQFELAESYFDYTTKNHNIDAVLLSFGCAPYYWGVARTHFSLYKSSGKRRHLRLGRKHMKLLQQLVGDGYPDASLRLDFLVAQLASVRKRPLGDAALRVIYRGALNRLAESEYLALEGLLNEQAGFDFAKRGLRAEAKTYFDRALYLYWHEWGAMAKYNQLSQTMTCWMESESDQTRPVAASLLSGLCIDIASK